MEWDLIGILATIAFLAGFFDAIAGGGGLITLPALFLAGIEPISAMATNKLQATSASISATVIFARNGWIEWRNSVFLVLFSLLGGVSGALFVSVVSKRVLEACVPILLIVVAIYFIFAPKLSGRSNRKRISVLLFSFLIAPVLGFYDGIFGPGTGSFLMMSFMFFCGLEMMRAMSFTKLANASCNIGALFIFITKGVIIWPLALAMAIASFAGAQLGARYAVKIGPRLIRPMLILVCCVLAIKLISAENNPLRIMILNLL
ncbi:TSUP family transporter [Photorhabdus heterorhabditis]|uniref:Probable membrane transporter protein n=1 Tax=Photorhabdus heterorhabditis TaxID=880156 RepID=A0A5B0WAT0_9GAMM|nr:TSUP family transporter [Photorhabdus heterorhabditis]KAA1184006.1 TSUP family transporter [Photorhabdus heterorhabditis]